MAANYAMAMAVILALTTLTYTCIMCKYPHEFGYLDSDDPGLIAGLVFCMSCTVTVLTASYFMCGHSKTGYLAVMVVCALDLVGCIVFFGTDSLIVDLLYTALAVTAFALLLLPSVRDYYLR